MGSYGLVLARFPGAESHLVTTVGRWLASDAELPANQRPITIDEQIDATVNGIVFYRSFFDEWALLIRPAGTMSELEQIVLNELKDRHLAREQAERIMGLWSRFLDASKRAMIDVKDPTYGLFGERKWLHEDLHLYLRGCIRGEAHHEFPPPRRALGLPPDIPSDDVPQDVDSGSDDPNGRSPAELFELIVKFLEAHRFSALQRAAFCAFAGVLGCHTDSEARDRWERWHRNEPQRNADSQAQLQNLEAQNAKLVSKLTRLEDKRRQDRKLRNPVPDPDPERVKIDGELRAIDQRRKQIVADIDDRMLPGSGQLKDLFSGVDLPKAFGGRAPRDNRAECSWYTIVFALKERERKILAERLVAPQSISTAPAGFLQFLDDVRHALQARPKDPRGQRAPPGAALPAPPNAFAVERDLWIKAIEALLARSSAFEQDFQHDVPLLMCCWDSAHALSDARFECGVLSMRHWPEQSLDRLRHLLRGP